MDRARGGDQDGVDRRVVDQVPCVLVGDRSNFGREGGRPRSIHIEHGVHSSAGDVRRQTADVVGANVTGTDNPDVKVHDVLSLLIGWANWLG